jgi:hypothetical protein
MIESSQLMKKALKAVQKDLITIIAYVNYKKTKGLLVVGFFFYSCVAMALAHILFFAVMAMFLFPRSEVLC